MSHTSQVVDTTIPTARYGQRRNLPIAPVGGYADRFDARAVSYPVGASLYAVPNLAAAPGDSSRDFSPVGGGVTLGIAGGVPLLASAAGGGRLVQLAGVDAAEAGPVTIVWAGHTSTTAGTAGNGSTVLEVFRSGVSTVLYNYNGKLTLTHKGTTIASDAVTSDGGFHVAIVVINGASSALWVDGAKKTGTLAADLPGKRTVINGEFAKLAPLGTVGDGIGTFAKLTYQRALTDAEAATMTAWVVAERAAG